jgi:hypothetical protein
VRFSEREGFRSVSAVLQTESMDTELRNGLWSATYAVYFAEKTQYRFEPAAALRA